MTDEPHESRHAGADAGDGKTQGAQSDAQSQHKRHPRPRRPHPQPLPGMDGTMSDSVTNPTASPGAKKAARQRKSMVGGTSVIHNESLGRAHNPRAASVGGSLLQGTPGKEEAFAGSTFQDSPAPSALPVPKFFPRSPPPAAAPLDLRERVDSTRTPEKVASPAREHLEPQPSPLDILFRADQAQRRVSASVRLSPEAADRPTSSSAGLNYPSYSNQARRGIFLQELEGDDLAMPSPRAMPPNNPVLPTERSASSPGIRSTSADGDEHREQFTRSLKDLLFSNINADPTNTTPAAQTSTGRKVFGEKQRTDWLTPSPVQRPASETHMLPGSTQREKHYSLHYGNRNLSPLFMAAREDTPAGSPGLRQGASSPFAAPSASTPDDTSQLPQSRHIDPDTFSRNLMNQHIHGGQPSTRPNPPSARDRNASPSQQETAPTPARADAPRNIKVMEDDLRRILKLN